MFFADKGFKNEPKRCQRLQGKTSRSGAWEWRWRPRFSNAIRKQKPIGSQCGKETTVPFRPTQGRPVFLQGMLSAAKVDGSSVTDHRFDIAIIA